MTLTRTLEEYVRAAFSGIWVQTWEPDEAQREIAKLCETNKWLVQTWDCARGRWDVSPQGKGDPVFPLSPPPKGKDDQGGDLTRLVVLHNYHRFLNNPMVVQSVANAVQDGKGERNIFVVLSPCVQLPQEIEKLFVVVEHELPDQEALNDIANDLENTHGGNDGSQTPGEQGAPILAAAGLTRYEAEGAFALSLARSGRIEAQTVWELKCQALKKSGLLTLHRGKESFADLGGLEAVKTFCKRALAGRGRSRGILLLGVPGTGKSAFAKALGNEVGRPVLLADPGSWKGSLVGESERKTREALLIADAMQPAVLFVDEIEKALAGATGQHQGDSGVSADQLGTLLKWMSDHESDVFVIATSNDISKLPPEFTRAERWDAVFFLDLPDEEARSLIWDMYADAYKVGALGSVRDGKDNWTGAEIKSCCRLSALLGVPLEEAARHVGPVALTASDRVAALREWAEGRCLDASKPGVYRRAEKPEPNSRAARRNVRA